MLESLKIFRLVAERGSFTRAAEAAGLSRPAVSHHIKQLEEHFGLSLFARTTRRVELTPAGETLLRHCRVILQAAEEMEAAMRVLSHARGRHVTVASSTLPSEKALPMVVAGLRSRKNNGSLDVRVQVGNSTEVLAWVGDGTADLALVGCPADDERLVCEPFAEDEIVLALPPGWDTPDVLPKDRVRELPLILREPGSATRRAVLEALGRHRIDLGALHVVAEMSSSESIRAAVQAGLGCAFFSTAVLRPGEFPTARIEGVSIRRSLYLCWRRDTPLTSEFQRLLDELRAAFSAHGSD